MVFRVQREFENLHLYHNTFVNNTQFMMHADFNLSEANRNAFDEDTYDAKNNLYVGSEFPKELNKFGIYQFDNYYFNSSINNIDTIFVDATNNNFKLVKSISASQAIFNIFYDAKGDFRTVPVDYGAYEFI
jgi:hypothetical protein